MPRGAAAAACGGETADAAPGLRYRHDGENRIPEAMISRLANPARFMRISGAALPWCAWLTVAVLAAGLYLALVAAPA